MSALDVRLLWQSRTSGEKGAFALRGGALHLAALPGGRLDRLAADPGSRPGFSVAAGEGVLRLTAHGNCAFLRGDRVETSAELTAEALILRAADGAEIELRAEGLPSAAAPTDPLVGHTLGSYRIRERLGSGSVGVVYKAVQAGLEREVALKVLNPKAATPLTVVSFKREAVAAGRLSHPNLVQVYEIGHEQGLHFFSMELVPGGNLEARLKEHGPLPWREALGYALDCAEALAFAQDHHVVHRDVKPENLMLTKDGRAKLADLGMAATRGMLEQESAGGSPHFMAPECVSGTPDHRADFYSLGCTLYRLLTGETPYAGATVKDILRAHRDEAVPSARAHAPEVPAEVDHFIATLMAKDPAERPADARSVAEAITALLQPRRSRVPLVLLGVLALGAAGTAAFFALRPSEPVQEPERVIEYRERDETPEQRAEREALELERSFFRAMAAPEGQERSAALAEFLAAHPDTRFTQRAQDELGRLEALAAQPVPAADDPLERMRAELARLDGEVDGLLQGGQFGAAHARLEQSGLPPQVRGPLDERVGAAADAAMARWEGSHERALAAQDWTAAEQVRRDFAAALAAGAGGAPPPANWSQRLDALAAAGAAAEQAARAALFEAERHAVLTALQGPVQQAILLCDPARALTAYDAALAACTHSGLHEALAAERELFAAAAPAAQALRARLDGSAEVAITEPLDGKRALAVQAGDAGIRLLVQIRGERVERTDPWSAFGEAGDFLSLLRAVIPAEVPDESVVALHLLFGEASMAARLRSTAPPDAAAAAQRAAEAAAWLEPLPRLLRVEPAWLARHRAAIRAFADLHAALAEQDSYLAWQRALALTREFSLLGAWSSDGTSTWQFRP